MRPCDPYYRHENFFRFIDSVDGHRWLWVPATIILLLIDYLTGPLIRFPVLYTIPLSLACWSGNRTWAWILAPVIPSLRILLNVLWGIPPVTPDILINISINIIAFAGLVRLLTILKDLHLLRGVLHVCSYCHSVRNSDGQWISMERYLSRHSEALLSHGVCPDCRTHWFGDGPV